MIILKINTYHASVIVEYVFVYKNWEFLTLKFKWAYLGEFLFPCELRNICQRTNTKVLENEKNFESRKQGQKKFKNPKNKKKFVFAFFGEPHKFVENRQIYRKDFKIYKRSIICYEMQFQLTREHLERSRVKKVKIHKNSQ